MLEFHLQGPDDVNSALDWLASGHSVRVIAGEVARRPKSWLVQDTVERAALRDAYARDPRWVTRGVARRRGYLKSCVLVPDPRDGRSGGTAGDREPRTPSPGQLPSMQVALDPPE